MAEPAIDFTADLQAFRAKFGLDYLTVSEQGGWVLSVRPGQPTLGSMVLSIASGVQDLAALPPQAKVMVGLALLETSKTKR